MKTNEVGSVQFSPEFTERFKQYGSYSNYGRAIPQVTDGLKPIQRRAIWSMWHVSKSRHNSSFYKASSVIGDIMGKYHPHGDSAIYGALATLAQDFKTLMPMVTPQGNWGSLDDPEDRGAPRYTECRLSINAALMMGDINATGTYTELDEDAVDMVPTYNGANVEPVALPALIPAMVVNGSEGMGTGVRIKTPSHNMAEVLKLAIHMLDHENPRTETILKILPGPDLPADCDIYDNDGGIESYITEGLGSFVMRARWVVEEYKISARKKGHQIIINGLPYRVSPEDVADGISDLIEDELLSPKFSVSNSSDGDETRIILDIGDGDVDDTIQRLLYHSGYTKMQSTYDVMNNPIAEGYIQTTSIVDSLRQWIRHRKHVVRRRSQFRLNKSQARLHIIEGFLKAIPIAEEIVTLIRNSENRADALEQMQDRWDFSEQQGNAFLDMSIGQITRLGVGRYEADQQELREIVDECTEILNNDDRLKRVLKDEMQTVIKKYGLPRRSQVVEGDWRVDKPDTEAVEIPVTNTYLCISGRQWVRNVQRPTIERQTEADYVTQIHKITNFNNIECITDYGYHSRLPSSEAPKSLTNSKVLFAFALDAGENPVLAQSAAPFGQPDIIMLTNYGNIKRISYDRWTSHNFNRYYKVIGMKHDDEVVTSAFFLPERKDIGILSAYGQFLKVDPDQIVPKGDAARGMAGIALMPQDNDSVVWAGPVDNDDELAYWTDNSRVAYLEVGQINRASRGTKGRTITRTEDLISGATLLNDEGTLNVYHSSMDSPQEYELHKDGYGVVGINDSKMLQTREQLDRTGTIIWSPGAQDYMG